VRHVSVCHKVFGLAVTLISDLDTFSVMATHMITFCQVSLKFFH